MIDLMDRVLHAILLNTVAPTVVKTGRLGSAIYGIKRMVVELAVLQSGTNKSILAKHFDRSDRWVYRLLEEIENGEAELKERQRTPLIFDVVNLFYAEAPRALSIDDVYDMLKVKRQTLKRKALADQFQVFEDTGFLKKGEEKGLYRLAERLIEVNTEGLEERMARVERSVWYIVPSALAYVRGQPNARFANSKLNVTARAWSSFVTDVQRFIAERAHQAVMESLEQDPTHEASESHLILFTAATFDDEEGGS